MKGNRCDVTHRAEFVRKKWRWLPVPTVDVRNLSKEEGFTGWCKFWAQRPPWYVRFFGL